MRWIDKLGMRYRMLFHRGRESRRLDAELEFHLEQQIAENVAASMSAKEARHAAMRALGNPTLLRDQARENWSWTWLELLLRDLRYAVRTLARAPGFSLTAIAVMALGIGATVALFTIVHSVLMKPLPFPGQDRLMMVYEAETASRSMNRTVAGGTFESWQQHNRSFAQMGLIVEDAYNLSSAGGALPERVQAEAVSWNVLPLLGIQPPLGRLFTPADDTYGAAKTVVVTWGFWKRRLGGNPAAIGSTLVLDAEPFTVIGVLPVGFAYPDTKTEVWTEVMPQLTPDLMESHDAHNFHVIGRLKPGTTIAVAEADLSAISAQERKRFPDGPVDNAANLRPLLEDQVGDIETPLYALLGATGCLLLIACLNVTNLWVARGAVRRRELAIRTALGGGRARRIRAQMMESVVLAAAGAVAGIGLAAGALHWLLSVRTDIPRASAIHLDGTVALFAAGLALLCGMTAGVAPALMEDDRQALQTLQESSRSSSGGQVRARLRKTLLTIEVGLTVVLLIGSGLLLRSYARLRAVNIGCATHDVLTMELNLPEGRYQTPEKKTEFFAQVAAEMRALPGVRGVGLTTRLPGDGHGQDDSFTIQEDPPLKNGKWLGAAVRYVSPEYFQTMQIPLLRGRTFLPTEKTERNRYAIVSESFVKQYFPGRDPIGMHIMDVNNGLVTDKAEAGNQIVGVVGDTRETVYWKAPEPTIYYPLYGGLRSDAYLAVKTPYDPLNLALPIQKAIGKIDKDLPLANILTMDQIIGQSTSDANFEAVLLTAFAAISLVLAAVGLFGVLSYLAAQQTTEIGIRMALGAQRPAVFARMLEEGMRPALYGLGMGLAASFGATRLIQSMLYNTQPFDLEVFALVATVLLWVAAIACVLPAWRASRLDPMQALRME
ncbi:MAG TPA: ABC transporter permease [Acidobacteriaceae bacterium]|jgi:putative ABC transport system permease protein|nr:ABC transporter permease [Acidobacteriaceae bacterium]